MHPAGNVINWGCRAGGMDKSIREAERRNTDIGALNCRCRWNKEAFFPSYFGTPYERPSIQTVASRNSQHNCLVSVSSGHEQRPPASWDPLLYFKTRNGRSSLREELPPTRYRISSRHMEHVKALSLPQNTPAPRPFQQRSPCWLCYEFSPFPLPPPPPPLLFKD